LCSRPHFQWSFVFAQFSSTLFANDTKKKRSGKSVPNLSFPKISKKYNKDHLSKLASCFNLLYNWNKIFFWNFVALLKFFRTKLDIIQIFSIVSFANFVGSLFLSSLKLISGGLCSLSHTHAQILLNYKAQTKFRLSQKITPKIKSDLKLKLK
jgi:hypothetical protein